MNVSIVTPTFNRAHLLPRLFTSLLRSTVRPAEWVVVDDGSEDSTAHLIAELASRAPFALQYVYQENQNLGGALNTGFTVASSPLILKIDNDDLLHPRCIETSLTLLTGHCFAEIAGVGGLCALEETGRIIGTEFPGDLVTATYIELKHNYKVRGDKYWMLVAEHLPNPLYEPHWLGDFGMAPVLNHLARKGLPMVLVNSVGILKNYLKGGISDIDSSQSWPVEREQMSVIVQMHNNFLVLTSGQGDMRSNILLGRSLLWLFSRYLKIQLQRIGTWVYFGKGQR